MINEKDYEGKYFGFPGQHALPAGFYVEDHYWQNDHFGKIISIVKKEPNFKAYLLNEGRMHTSDETFVVTYRTLGAYSEIRKMRAFLCHLGKIVISDNEEEMFDNVKLLKELGEFI